MNKELTRILNSKVNPQILYTTLAWQLKYSFINFIQYLFKNAKEMFFIITRLLNHTRFKSQKYIYS